MRMALYFRIRDGGATVFRAVEDAARRRLDLQPLADVVLRSGAVKPRGAAAPTAAENAEIETWIAERRARLAARFAEAPERAVEAMNEAAEWLRARPEGPDRAAMEAEKERLLMAMHDLRAAILRARDGSQDD